MALEKSKITIAATIEKNNQSLPPNTSLATQNNNNELISLSDCNWARTHNHLVRKRTLKHLAKLAK